MERAIGASRDHAVLDGERAAFALCRPPGHHAGADYHGGYCHLNAAAIAAQAARDAGVARVAILDIDYHHGNGTQDIFWTRGDVFYASVHADPATDYPFYWGHADEIGEGDGRGATLNLPLPQGTDARRLPRRAGHGAGGDRRVRRRTAGGELRRGHLCRRPDLALRTADAAIMPCSPRDIAAAGWPTVIVMEGGYAVDALGGERRELAERVWRLSDATILRDILRVDHAGEAGAIRIYRVQIAVARRMAPDLGRDAGGSAGGRSRPSRCVRDANGKSGNNAVLHAASMVDWRGGVGHWSPRCSDATQFLLALRRSSGRFTSI